MSAREFKFGDRVRIAHDPMYTEMIGREGMVTTIDTESQTCRIVFNDGKRLVSHIDWLEPSAQPHVAAGEGWRERTKKAIENARDLSYVLGCVEERNESTSEMADAKADDVDFQVTIDALLAEVVELPSVDLKTIRETADQYVVDFGQEISLQLAAALIRAATSAEDKASQ